MDFNNDIPIYTQILDYIKVSIISGKLKPGDKLPSIREYANILKVNPNTMQKAMIELEWVGLIYTERTSGKYVTRSQKTIERLRKEYADRVVNDFFIKMKKIGLNEANAVDYLRRRYEK